MRYPVTAGTSGGRRGGPGRVPPPLRRHHMSLTCRQRRRRRATCRGGRGGGSGGGGGAAPGCSGLGWAWPGSPGHPRAEQGAGMGGRRVCTCVPVGSSSARGRSGERRWGRRVPPHVCPGGILRPLPVSDGAGDPREENAASSTFCGRGVAGCLELEGTRQDQGAQRPAPGRTPPNPNPVTASIAEL